MNIRSLPACLRPCALAVLAVGAGQMLHAQGLPDTPGLTAPALQDTVVSATRTEQPLSDLVADLSIIERETIERSGLTGVADLLARLPGVEMARNGG
ncbi:TonB-dependent receptor, partial [Verminephrobacter sp. Larva24]